MPKIHIRTLWTGTPQKPCASLWTKRWFSSWNIRSSCPSVNGNHHNLCQFQVGVQINPLVYLLHLQGSEDPACFPCFLTQALSRENTFQGYSGPIGLPVMIQSQEKFTVQPVMQCNAMQTSLSCGKPMGQQRDPQNVRLQDSIWAFHHMHPEEPASRKTKKCS